MQTIQTSHEYSENSANALDTTETTPKLLFLVVIDQKQALIFTSELKNSAPEHIHVFDPGDVLKHLKQRIGADAASHATENLNYYKEVTAALADADEILLMGHGTGASSAMVHLQDFLAAHHQEISKKIVGALKVDIDSMTEGQMLQEARAFFLHHDGRD